MKQSQGWCRYCGKYVLTQRPTRNHLLHFLITILSCGAWVFVWLILAICTPAWRCSKCGSKV